jgi:hypothetical protein
MTTTQFNDLMMDLKLLAVEMRETRQLVIDAIADIGDIEARIAALDMRFDE